jgi:hypothetical protein
MPRRCSSLVPDSTTSTTNPLQSSAAACWSGRKLTASGGSRVPNEIEQAVTFLVGGVDRDRGAAGVAGEFGRAGEAADVADLSDQYGCGGVTDPGDLQKRRRQPVDEFPDCGLQVTDTVVEVGYLGDHVRERSADERAQLCCLQRGGQRGQVLGAGEVARGVVKQALAV